MAALLYCSRVFQTGVRCCEVLGKEHFFESCRGSHFSSVRELLQSKKYLASVLFSGETTVILKQGRPLLNTHATGVTFWRCKQCSPLNSMYA